MKNNIQVLPKVAPASRAILEQAINALPEDLRSNRYAILKQIGQMLDDDKFPMVTENNLDQLQLNSTKKILYTLDCFFFHYSKTRNIESTEDNL